MFTRRSCDRYPGGHWNSMGGLPDSRREELGSMMEAPGSMMAVPGSMTVVLDSMAVEPGMAAALGMAKRCSCL